MNIFMSSMLRVYEYESDKSSLIFHTVSLKLLICWFQPYKHTKLHWRQKLQRLLIISLPKNAVESCVNVVTSVKLHTLNLRPTACFSQKEKKERQITVRCVFFFFRIIHFLKVHLNSQWLEWVQDFLNNKISWQLNSRNKYGRAEQRGMTGSASSATLCPNSCNAVYGSLWGPYAEWDGRKRSKLWICNSIVLFLFFFF